METVELRISGGTVVVASKSAERRCVKSTDGFWYTVTTYPCKYDGELPRRERSNGSCKGCPAGICWSTSNLGRRIPLDPATLEVRLVENESGVWEPSPTYMNHFLNCPKSEDFSRR
jgi:hypothetical protein